MKMITLNSILQFSKHFQMYYYMRSLQKFCASEYSVVPILRCGFRGLPHIHSQSK